MKTQNGSHSHFLLHRHQPTRWFLCLVLVLGLFLIGYTVPSNGATDPSVPNSTEFIFQQYEIMTGQSKHQTVLAGFLFGGPVAEIVVISVDGSDDRHLRIYEFSEGAWRLKQETRLRPEVLFVDVAEIGGRDRLITYETGCLSWFDPDAGTEHLLVRVTSDFRPPRSDEVPHVNIAQDVNADTRDDLVVPDSDGFWVFIQMSEGAFAERVKIGPPTDMTRIRGADGYRYDPWSQSRVYEMDYDRDGRTDLVFWNGDRFEVHLQGERGLFREQTKTFKTEVTFDSDRLSALTTGGMVGRVLHTLADLNGDTITDLVVFELLGDRITNKQSTYAVHFGALTPEGGTAFSPEVDLTFQSEGKIQLGMERHDFDSDGKVGLMITTLDRRFLKGNLWKRIKGFMGDDVWLDIEFYRMEGDRYADNPNAVHRLALDGVPSHREIGWVPLDVVLRGGTHERRNTEKRYPRAFNTTLRLGDVTGDGCSDLLLGDHPRMMKVLAGVPGPEMFVKSPQEVAVTLPNDEEYTLLVDLNKDGIQDILMHHPFTLRDAHGAPIRTPGTEPHRVTMLIAKQGGEQR